MLIHSASQLLTLAGTPQRGSRLGQLNIIEDGAVLIQGETIAAVGTTAQLRSLYPKEEDFEAKGRVVMPGFVDPHTHIIWAGDRAAEFEMRLQGKTYLEIMDAGGGIVSTVRATRAASKEKLKSEAIPRLRSAFKHGTTTMEAKSGYGLNTETELCMLETLLELDEETPLDLAPTFLGAHAIPEEYKENSQAYTALVCKEMLPALHARYANTDTPLPFVDVFCETGAFNLAQSRQILETAQELGFPLKVHADEFDNLGGSSLAAELGAVSADHLVVTSSKDIAALAASNTVAVGLPCTPFGLAESEYTPAKAIVEAGALLAIATDLNPGTAWCENMQFAIALACRYMKLTPAQAIAAATINAAAAIQRENQVGSLEVGKQADLLVLNLTDYRHLGYRFGTNLVQTIIKNGQIYAAKETYAPF